MIAVPLWVLLALGLLIGSLFTDDVPGGVLWSWPLWLGIWALLSVLGWATAGLTGLYVRVDERGRRLQ
jgi:hypothetical protein